MRDTLDRARRLTTERSPDNCPSEEREAVRMALLQEYIRKAEMGEPLFPERR